MTPLTTDGVDVDTTASSSLGGRGSHLPPNNHDSTFPKHLCIPYTHNTVSRNTSIDAKKQRHCKSTHASYITLNKVAVGPFVEE